MTYFKKILIANRGEIARRIIRSCKKMNIATVAVYSDSDKDALFVNEADEAVHIGNNKLSESYLNIDKILEVAKVSQVDAIHPGYGFLAENATFARACEENHIKFIGPSSEIIALMGDKIASREKMEEAGVPIVPGWNGSLESVEQALEKAEEIGYPVMLKASAGGGGIGMRLALNSDELQNIFVTTQQQAQNFFGNGSVFLEKWIKNPRHIEVQIVADQFGTIVHLFERECSIQRRNQKIIEESPSPSISDDLRSKLFEAALRGAHHINYQNIGTMEFIFDEDNNFYFLEMNTRLQVEHPVTELVTGLDLVELQIKIAANEPLNVKQDDICISGHAIEVRLCAEDAITFLPSPGEITKLLLPEGKARYDFAVQEGSFVSPFFDSMIGKVIVNGQNRAEALLNLQNTVQQIQVEGIKCNLALIDIIAKDKKFQEGYYTTTFIEQLQLKERIIK